MKGFFGGWKNLNFVGDFTLCRFRFPHFSFQNLETCLPISGKGDCSSFFVAFAIVSGLEVVKSSATLTLARCIGCI